CNCASAQSCRDCSAQAAVVADGEGVGVGDMPPVGGAELDPPPPHETSIAAHPAARANLLPRIEKTGPVKAIDSPSRRSVSRPKNRGKRLAAVSAVLPQDSGRDSFRRNPSTVSCRCALAIARGARHTRREPPQRE